MLRIFMLLNLIQQFLAIPIIKYPPSVDLTAPSVLVKSPYDSHNCCISCGYEYCDTLMECIRPWEVECPKLINPFIITDDTPKALVAPLVLK